MPATAAVAETPMLPRRYRYDELERLSALLDERREQGSVGHWTVQDLDACAEDTESYLGTHELYSIPGLRVFVGAIAWWQDTMEIALKLHYQSMPRTSGNLKRDPAEDEFLNASNKSMNAYSEAISEAIRNTRGADDDSLVKATQAVIEYRKFTRCTAAILSRLFPELNHEALLQIP